MYPGWSLWHWMQIRYTNDFFQQFYWEWYHWHHFLSSWLILLVGIDTMDGAWFIVIYNYSRLHNIGSQFDHSAMVRHLQSHSMLHTICISVKRSDMFYDIKHDLDTETAANIDHSNRFWLNLLHSSLIAHHEIMFMMFRYPILSCY